MNEQPTNTEILEVLQSSNSEILEAIQSFAASVDERFNGLEGRVTNVESTMATKADLAGMATKADLAGMATKADLVGMATKADLARMVTKDYLDDKLADLHSDIVNFVKRRVPGWSEA